MERGGPRLYGTGVTVAAHQGRVSITGLGDQQQNQHAQAVARRVAGGGVSGELSSDLG